jgi:PAS domain S-box-containing protein
MFDQQKNSISAMQFNRLSLAFCGRHGTLESLFQSYYFNHTLIQMRIGMAAAFFFFAIFGIMDALVMPERYIAFWIIRWAVVCPSILIALLISFSAYAERFLQLAGSAVTLIAGLGIIAMTHLAASGHSYSYVGGLVQIIFFIFTFSRLRFVWAASVTTVLTATFIACALYCGSAHDNLVVGSIFHVVVIGLMGMMAGYAIEFQTRRNFFLSRQLQSKKRRLRLVNRFLEERVSKKTLELKNANQQLKKKIEEGNTIQAKLRASRQLFQNIFETVSAGLFIVEKTGHTIVQVNPAAAQLTGEPAEHLRGMNLARLIQPAGPDKGAPPAFPISHPVECRLTCRQGDSIPIILSAREIEIEGRQHWIVSFGDIQKIKEAETIKRELEIRSTRAQHLQAIGTMAGGIAHDFNNILFGMLGYTELALEDAAAGSIQASNLQEVLRGGHRAKEIIYQILTFSRQESVEKRAALLCPLIKEALKLLRATIPATVDIETRLAADTHHVLADPTRIHQVIMNLCTNAAAAIGDRPGRICISLDNQCLCAEDCVRPDALAPGDYVRLVVEDNGPGIPDDIIDHIFEPFFTTKSQGKGTGMGLAVVLGIVQDHQGSISVHCEPGHGARFEILLPASPEETNDTQTIVAPVVQGSEHILFIDDEKPLGTMVNRMLSKLGYRVTVSDHPAKALALFRDQPKAFDLVITDLTMPEMSGLGLARHLLEIRPEQPLVLCTGYSEQITLKQCRELGFRGLLHKPVSRQELTATVRNALIAN